MDKILSTFTMEQAAMVVAHSIVLYRIIYISILTSLTQLMHITTLQYKMSWPTLVQVRLKMILKYHNQYFYLGIVHFNSRPSQLSCRLPLNLVVIR